jgi:hypothetical protein
MGSIGLKFHFNTKAIDDALEALSSTDVIAVIYSDARSPEGKYYFNWVNDGRGPVHPIHAKALHWIDPKTGKDVFAAYAGPSAPRHIREKALPIIRQIAISAVVKKSGPLSRELLVQFVNDLAHMAVAELQEQTPGDGPLKNSYRIDKAT